MDCTEARTLMLSVRRGAVAEDRADAVRAHVADCAACRHADAADAELTRALARLPRRAAPEDLRRRLEARYAPGARPAPSPRADRANEGARRAAPGVARLAIAGAVALAIAAGAALVLRAPTAHDASRADPMLVEAVNDHLRVLYSERGVEVESGGIHQVKPWFAGKVDFAPTVRFGGDADYPLKGGSVAYFIDRKAAAFVFGRRLHTITLLVFEADGLPWPTSGGDPLGAHRAWARSSRGFHTVMWRDGDLGYAAVSDLNEAELRELAGRVEGAGAGH